MLLSDLLEEEVTCEPYTLQISFPQGNSRDAEDGYQMHRRKSSAEVKQMVMAVFSNNEGSPDQAGKSQNRKCINLIEHELYSLY